MFALIIFFHILASIFLILVILLQAGRGGGLSDSFGGGAMQNIFGTSSQTVLTKVTAACATIFILTSLTLTILTGRREKSLIDVQRGRVADIVTRQKMQPAASSAVQPQPAQTAAQPAVSPQGGPAAPVETSKAEAAKTVTVREVKIDPATGKEVVVKEEKMTPEEASQRNKKE
jgi:preprotein translocase subunit SecG